MSAPIANPTGEPFPRVLIWKPGVNDSDKGPAVWNEKARRQTMAIYATRDNLVLLDINHNMSEDGKAKRLAAGISDDPHTAGECALEADASGLWMIPRYSDYALARIKGRELCYVSPEFIYDKKTREVCDIVRISLVHEPATWGARLVASAANRMKWSKGMPPDMLAKLMELADLMAAEGVSDALKAKISEVIAAAQGGGEAPVVEPDALAAIDPAKGKPPAIAMAKSGAADRFAAKRAAIEGSMLCSSMRGQLVQELKARGAAGLLPAEEQALSKHTDPDALEVALALLKAGPRFAKVEPHREPERKAAEPKKPGDLKPGGYAAAGLAMLAARGLEVPS